MERRRQGIGFSPEIETPTRTHREPPPQGRRQGIGFSPEIETLSTNFLKWYYGTSPGDWLLA